MYKWYEEKFDGVSIDDINGDGFLDMNLNIIGLSAVRSKSIKNIIMLHLIA